MKPRWPKPSLWILTMATLFSSLGLAMSFVGIRVNRTASLPVGLYQISAALPVRGGLVAVCLPDEWSAQARERGYIRGGDCPDGSEPLLKRLAALPGDDVRVGPEGVVVNGRPQPESRVLLHDRHGRALASSLRSGIVPEGFALVLAPAPGSFDGRYVGLVPLERLRSMRPLLTFNGGVFYGSE